MGPEHRRVDPGIEQRGDPSLLGDEPVAVRRGQRVAREVGVAAQPARGPRDGDPGQQLGIAGVVGPSVGGGAHDPAVRPTDGGDHAKGLAGGAERGDGDVGGRVAQPSERILVVAGVLGNPGHREGVGQLDQQRPDAPDDRRGVGVQPPRGGVGAQQPAVALRGRGVQRRLTERPAQPPPRQRRQQRHGHLGKAGGCAAEHGHLPSSMPPPCVEKRAARRDRPTRVGVPRVSEPRRLGDVRDIHLTDACSAGLVFALIIRSVT